MAYTAVRDDTPLVLITHPTAISPEVVPGLMNAARPDAAADEMYDVRMPCPLTGPFARFHFGVTVSWILSTEATYGELTVLYSVHLETTSCAIYMP